MQTEIVSKLRARGLNVDFLLWLEGPSQRLPQFFATHKLRDSDMAGAIRAASWLRAELKQAGHETAEEWRYRLLEEFLVSILKSSIVSRSTRQREDLRSLSRVLSVVLPVQSRARYDQDIERLGKTGFKNDFLSGLPRGPHKKEESEETQRMRAAIAYLEPSSDSPFVDLADLWSEGDRQYDPDQIRQRLRKGHQINRSPAAAQGMLDCWQRIYKAEDWRFLSPGPFPLSPELEEVAERKRMEREIAPL